MNTELINGEPQDINELASIETLITEQKLRSAQIAVELNGKIIPKSSHAETLVKEYFDVMVCTSDDPLVAKSLEKIGCVATMPLEAPIGLGLGIRNPYNIRIILKKAKEPILMASVMNKGVKAGREAYLAGRMPRRLYTSPSSPIDSTFF